MMDEDTISFSKEEMISIRQSFVDGLNAEPSLFMKSIIHSNQPERSKREDDIMYLKCTCGEYKHINDFKHRNRCGALNTAVTP
jgi:hypothetical protein